jgi:hypothetical protein
MDWLSKNASGQSCFIHLYIYIYTIFRGGNILIMKWYLASCISSYVMSGDNGGYSMFWHTCQQKVRRTMLSMRIKLGLVSALSCLVILLGLFTSTGVASAHSVQATHSQTSVSVSTADRCRFIVVRVVRFKRTFFGFRRIVFFRTIRVCHRQNHLGFKMKPRNALNREQQEDH